MLIECTSNTYQVFSVVLLTELCMVKYRCPEWPRLLTCENIFFTPLDATRISISFLSVFDHV